MISVQAVAISSLLNHLLRVIRRVQIVCPVHSQEVWPLLLNGAQDHALVANDTVLGLHDLEPGPAEHRCTRII